MQMNNKENIQHQEKLRTHFAGLTSYWKNIYKAPVGQNDFYHHEAVKKRKQAVLDFVDAFSGGRKLMILDAGCGAGMIMEPLIQRGHRVVGVDITVDMVKETEAMVIKYGQDCSSVGIGTVEALGFPGQSFDLCICIGVLQYLREDETALRELSRVTKPGGRVIISLPNMARFSTLCDPYYYLYRLPLFIVHRVFKPSRKKETTVSKDIGSNLSFRNRRYLYGSLRGVYRRYGFMVRGVCPIGYGPLTFWRHEYLPRSFTLWASRKLERLALLGGFSFFKIVADRWVVALQKSWG